MHPQATCPSLELLVRALLDRKTRNPSYSLRAFARDLGVSVTSLAEVMAGKRDFSRKNGLKVADRLGLTPEQTRLLLRSRAPREAPAEQEFQQLQEDRFRLVSDWYHYAILNLAKLKANQADPKAIARRLGLSVLEVKSAIRVLRRLGFLEIEDGRLKRTATPLFFNPADMPGALKKFHKQNLKLAERAIDREPVDRRYLTTFILPVDRNKMESAKKKILAFQKKTVGYLETGEPTEVYAFVIQLFPLTSDGG